MTRLENDAGTLIAERGLKLVADEANNSKGVTSPSDDLRAKLGALGAERGELTTSGRAGLDADKVDNGKVASPATEGKSMMPGRWTTVLARLAARAWRR
ncbi:hypothetical protein P4126_33795 [Pseudomonas aeruginosa]|nr:hypothetical protein [Pseudomonas aeruginosa]